MVNPDKDQSELYSIYQNQVNQEKEITNNLARQYNEQLEMFTEYMNQTDLEVEQISQLYVKKMIEKVRRINVLSIIILCLAISTAIFAVAFFSSAEVPITLIALSISLVTVISISVIPWGLIKERLIDGR